nr:glutathione S-transferase family protein [Sphingomonas lacunae]
MRLYTCAGSRGLRCSWTICELGVEGEIELVLLPFPPRAFDKSYFQINGLGTVPALVDGDITMTESSAICHYLTSRFPAPAQGPIALSPDEADYGRFLDWLHHADATLTFPQTVALRFCQFEKDRGLEAAGEAYGDWFGKRLAKADARLQQHEWLAGDRFTVADIAVGYALYLSRMTRLDHHLTPTLRDYLARLTARPGFQRALAWEKATGEAQGVANRLG